MKKSLYLLLGLLLVCSIYQACAPEELPGSIYGTVVDKATGEPIKSAGVELSPVGLKTVTGSEGQFEFTELDPDKYTLLVTKTGYMAGVSHTIEVKPGQQVKGDLQIEKMPPALKVVDGNRKEIDTLDFGSSIDDVARSFSIFNDGTESLEWQITTTAEWIKSVSKAEGVLSAGATQSLIITIDRTKLGSGENKTTVHITSNNGSKQLILLAMGQVVTKLNVLSVTNVKSRSVILHGEIVDDGIPKYTECGFVYSESSMPTIKECIKKVTIPVTNDKKYSITLDNLVTNRTYYARAYAIQKGDEVYSTNEVVFVPKSSPGKVETTNVTVYNDYVVYFTGNIIEVGEPIYTECGFVYGANSNPTIDNSKKAVAPYTGRTGVYSMQITNPDLDVLSYVRAYITNGGETSYGEALTFKAYSEQPKVDKPTITNISPSGGEVTFNSYITRVGSPTYTECGFVYNTSSNPTLENGTKIIVNTNGSTGNYSITVSQLIANTAYYVRAFITNRAGTYYSEETKFDLESILPIVETLDVTNLSISSAIFKGSIRTLGDPTYTECGFVYGTMLTPTLENGAKILNAGFVGVGTIEKIVTDLVFNQEYYVRMYAKNADTVAYGNSVLFYGRDPNWIFFEELGLMVTTYDLGTNSDWELANNICKNLNLSDYTDWYLPDFSELGLLYILKDKIGNFNAEYYWSSTEFDSDYAYAIVFNYGRYSDNKPGTTHKVSKSGGYNTAVRCVRKN